MTTKNKQVEKEISKNGICFDYYNEIEELLSYSSKLKFKKVELILNELAENKVSCTCDDNDLNGLNDLNDKNEYLELEGLKNDNLDLNMDLGLDLNLNLNKQIGIEMDMDMFGITEIANVSAKFGGELDMAVIPNDVKVNIGFDYKL